MYTTNKHIFTLIGDVEGNSKEYKKVLTNVNRRDTIQTGLQVKFKVKKYTPSSFDERFSLNDPL